MSFNYIFKVIVIGSNSIGKSSFIEDNNEYSHTDCIDPLGVHLQIVPQVYNNLRIQLQLWNIQASSKFINLYENYFQGGKGYILCFDKSDRDSFKYLDSWMRIIGIFIASNIPIILVGTKSSLENKVKENEIRSLIKNENLISYYLNYNNTKYERDFIFKILIKLILKRCIKPFKRSFKIVRNPRKLQYLYEDLFQNC